MKYLYLLFLVSIVGCASGSPPTGIERTIYDIRTNLQPKIVLATNGTDIVLKTNWVEDYELAPKQVIGSTISTVGGIASTAGIPWAGAAGTLLAAAYAGWAEYRNSRKKKLNTTFAQNIETAREIIKAQPGGETTDAKFVSEIKSQQVVAGVKADAAAVVDNQVNTTDATASAGRVNKP